MVLSSFGMGLLLGATLSAIVIWLFSGFFVGIPLGSRAFLVVVVASIAFLRDAGVVRLELPQNTRQVPRSVFDKGALRSTFQFGLELGTGVRTYISQSAPYVLAVSILLLSSSGVEALAAGLGFGTGRAVMPILRYLSRDREVWDNSLGRLLPVVSPLAIGCFGVLAVRLMV